MKPSDSIKIERFLKFFNSIHHLKNNEAYGDLDRTKPNPNKSASKDLFKQSIPFINKIPLDRITSVLDVGMGYGFHCEYFTQLGKKVTGLTVHLTDTLKKEAKSKNYKVVEMDMHFLDFPPESFDLIWSHHSLEHSFSPLFALREWFSVLRPGGYLAITVPPHKDIIVSGHFNVGWNIGQLVYLLGVCCFDVKFGYFIKEGYNVRALVMKPKEEIESKGISWMHQLVYYLPKALQKRMITSPKSIGKYSFDGALKELSDVVYVQKPHKKNFYSKLLNSKEKIFNFFKRSL